MTHKLIYVALIAAMIVTPAGACVDWKAILALDAVISAEIRNEIETEKAAGHKVPVLLLKENFYHKQDVINDKAAARANKCWGDEQ